MLILSHHITALAATAAAKFKTLFKRWLDQAAERQMRWARFEFEMYRGIYRHSSKNDDDLLAGSEKARRSSGQFVLFGSLLLRGNPVGSRVTGVCCGVAVGVVC
jgi:hypothetical protein